MMMVCVCVCCCIVLIVFFSCDSRTWWRKWFGGWFRHGCQSLWAALWPWKWAWCWEGSRRQRSPHQALRQLCVLFLYSYHDPSPSWFSPVDPLEDAECLTNAPLPAAFHGNELFVGGVRMQIARKDVWNKKNGEYVSYYVCGKRGCKVHARLFQSYVLVCVCS